MSIDRSIRDTLIAQSKELGFQLTLGKEIRNSVNLMSKVEDDLSTSSQSELGTQQEEIDLKKKLEALYKNRKSLALNNKILVNSNTPLTKEMSKNLTKQQKSNEELIKLAKERLKFNQKVRNNLAVGTFQFFQELAEKFTGVSSQIAIAFENAQNESRKVIVDHLLQKQKSQQQVQIVKEIKNHINSGGKFTLKEAKKWGLLSKNGKLLTGSAAKSHAQKIASMSDQITANSNPFKKFFKKMPLAKNSDSRAMGKAFAKGFKTFAKSLGGIVILAAINLAVKAIKFAFDLLAGASKMSAFLPLIFSFISSDKVS